ncbi:MAG: hypothetical protein QOF87_891 [Pseudonocardiales bacterium]|jgi:hypothetical protein|nr:hypothetical protein [Pseudonocardiales bacterium]
MSESFQVTFDAANPQRLGEFWAAVLGYVMQPPPEGFDSWDAFLDSVSWPADQRDAMYAIVDPEGTKPRLLFQKVPEGKTAKNRVHLDVNVGAGLPHDGRKSAVRTRADEIVALGATELRTAEENGEYWIVMQDIDGNEFCVQ